MYRYLLLLVLTGCMSPIDKINHRVNQVAYISDMENYGLADYRASPEEFYARGGDCEDYVIAKYAALIDLGVPPEDMKGVMLYGDEVHAVLSVRQGNKTYILDNMSDKVYLEARLENQVKTYFKPEED